MKFGLHVDISELLTFVSSSAWMYFNVKKKEFKGKMKSGHYCQKHPTGTFNKSMFPYVFLCVFISYSEPIKFLLHTGFSLHAWCFSPLFMLWLQWLALVKNIISYWHSTTLIVSQREHTVALMCIRSVLLKNVGLWLVYYFFFLPTIIIRLNIKWHYWE